MEQITRIGIDTSKRFFQLHGVNGAEQPIVRKKLPRDRMISFFQKLPPTIIALEACGASHHWARTLGAMGHTVKLIAPQLAKPYVKRGKNDAADAEALCEAASRPSMRLVPAKTAEQQAALMLAGTRDQLVRSRTRLANAIRGYAAEFGLTASTGPAQIAPLLERVHADMSLPELARELFAEMGEAFADLERRVAKADARLLAWQRANPAARRLAAIPGVGPVTAAMLAMKTPDPAAFKSGRDFAAWLGLTPKDHSTAGRVRLGGITRAGDETLRSLLVVGATSVIRHVRVGKSSHRSAWLEALLARKPAKLAAIALANKTARIAWRLLRSGEVYDRAHGVGSRAACDEGAGLAPAAA